MGDLVCIHGVDKAQHCLECTGLAMQRLGRAGARACEAGRRLKEVLELIPEEFWIELDKEIIRYDKLKIKKLIINLSIAFVFVILIYINLKV